MTIRWNLPTKAKNPFAYGYELELDETPVLESDLASCHQSQIEVLRWMVGLERVNIKTVVSMLRSPLALPKEGHLDAVFHMYAYLR